MQVSSGGGVTTACAVVVTVATLCGGMFSWAALSWRSVGAFAGYTPVGCGARLCGGCLAGVPVVGSDLPTGPLGGIPAGGERWRVAPRDKGGWHGWGLLAMGDLAVSGAGSAADADADAYASQCEWEEGRLMCCPSALT